MIENEKEARETLDRGIMISADKNLTVKDLSDHFFAKGYLAALSGPEFKERERVIEMLVEALGKYRGIAIESTFWADDALAAAEKLKEPRP